MGRRSTFQIFDDALHGKRRFQFRVRLSCKGVVTWTGFADLPRLHLLPASVELLRSRRQNSRIACPGHLSRYLDTALGSTISKSTTMSCWIVHQISTPRRKPRFSAADGCVVPYVPDYLSLSGFQVLAEQIRRDAGRNSLLIFQARRKPNIGGGDRQSLSTGRKRFST